jgi:hypothetical protein
VRALLLLISTLVACGTGASHQPAGSSEAADEVHPCATALPAPHLLPGSRPEHREPGFWISRLENPDELILTPEEIDAVNARALGIGTGRAGLGARFAPLAGPIDAEAILTQMGEGLARHRERADQGARVFLDGRRPGETFFRELESRQRGLAPDSGLHLTARLTELRCHPTNEGLYEYADDVDFDLLLCSTLRPGELVRVISRHRGGWALVRSSYVTGWIEAARLGPSVTEDQARELFEADPFVVVTTDRAPIWSTKSQSQQLAAVHIGLRLPLIGPTEDGLIQVRAPSREGLTTGWIDPSDVHIGYLPLTRRQVITQAFRQLDDAFGWAGAGGDRDCSRFLMDLFALFGLHLPRNSFFQSEAAPAIVETSELDSEQRIEALDRALERGIPLVYMPGHIMLLLGRDGADYHAIHQFSGYRVGCRPGHDVKMSVDRLSVTTLRLGEGSERHSFMDRFTRLSVIGRPNAQVTSL